MPQATDLRLAEIGCGTGYAFHNLLPDQLKIGHVGIDLDELPLTRFKNEQPSSRLVRANAYDLPFPDDSLDIILGLSSYDSIADLPEALSEVKRCLKHRGIFYHCQDIGPSKYFHSKDPSQPDGSSAEFNNLLTLQAVRTGLKILKSTKINYIAVIEDADVTDRLDDCVCVYASDGKGYYFRAFYPYLERHGFPKDIAEKVNEFVKTYPGKLTGKVLKYAAAHVLIAEK